MADELKGKTILLVDDDAEVLSAIKIALEDTGAEIDTASDGNTAVRKVASDQPDLVVLDLMLPKRSGFLVIERLRQTVADNMPRLIMITANLGQRHKVFAKSLGVDVYMTKPFRMDRLIESAVELIG